MAHRSKGFRAIRHATREAWHGTGEHSTADIKVKNKIPMPTDAIAHVRIVL